VSHGTRLFSYEDREEIARLTAALAARDEEIAALRETVRMLHAADRDAAAAIAAGVARAESAELGCEIAYRREPTQAEGDAHEYRHEQSMGPAHGRMPVIEVVSAVIARRGRVLLTQRRPGKDYAYAWETPGGKSEMSDSWHSALRRECMEELGITVGKLNEHPISSPLLGNIQFLLYAAREWSGEPRPLEGQGIGWFTLEEMRRLTLTPGTETSLDIIANEMRRSR
jgi:8-oxo-dGTP diphosphatase